MKVFSIAGFHRTGKTTVVVELIKELKRRRFKVVSIKDIHAEDHNKNKHLLVLKSVKKVTQLANQVEKRYLKFFPYPKQDATKNADYPERRLTGNYKFMKEVNYVFWVAKKI